MRRVARPENCPRRSRRPAARSGKAAFGDDRLLIEKYIDNRPRHIEVQVFGDSTAIGRASVRARLLIAAPPSEGHRGSAGARR
jgi:acetyl/propionyl-CoA carboxylase alpha subunit